MKTIFYRILLVLLLAGFSITGEASRFTVREIGCSNLTKSFYSLLIVDDEIDYDNPVFHNISRLAEQSDMSIILLDAQADASHPLLRKAKHKGISFPNVLFCTPDERIYPLYGEKEYSLQAFNEYFSTHILQSPLRRQMLEGLADTYAYIITVPGKHWMENRKAMKRVKEDCNRIKEVMPLMPGTVKNPPRIMNIKEKDFETEKILLCSLGFQKMPEHPYAVVVYGRGRLMGMPLNNESIQEGLVYKYLAMTGADGECDLNWKWMLGGQIPLYWDNTSRRQLAESLTFDVDDPMIITEMGQLLSKKKAMTARGKGFTPENIDLEKVFDNPVIKQKAEEPVEHSLSGVLLSILAVLLIVAVPAAIFIYRKSR